MRFMATSEPLVLLLDQYYGPALELSVASATFCPFLCRRAELLQSV